MIKDLTSFSVGIGEWLLVLQVMDGEGQNEQDHADVEDRRSGADREPACIITLQRNRRCGISFRHKAVTRPGKVSQCGHDIIYQLDPK